MKADLHTHSFFSADGVGAPDHVFAVARTAGIDLLAISEHNSCAHIPTCLALAETAPLLRFLPAVEVSCTSAHTGDHEIHILCYFIEPRHRLWADSEFSNLISTLSEVQIENLHRISRAASLSPSEVDVMISACRERGLIHPSATPSYYHLKRYLEALYGSDHALTRQLSEARRALRASRSLAPYPNYRRFADIMRHPSARWVLAHPMRYKWPSEVFEAVLAELAAAGLAGLETNYSNHMDDACRLSARAQRFGLKRTCGSDIHDFLHLQPRDYAGTLASIELKEEELAWLASSVRPDSP